MIAASVIMPKGKYSPVLSIGTDAKPRCAIYARYSSDMQRAASIDDQIRQCKEKAGSKGWLVLEEHIYKDAAISGASVIGRSGLAKLLEAAQQRPRPFDCVLIDDTSRFGRHLPQTLAMTEQLEYLGVFLYFVTLDLDTRAASSRTIHTVTGLMDEQYVKSLSEKVHRGQRGRFLNKCNPSGRCYGYRNVPILHPSKIMEYGRPAVIGVEQRVLEEEAKIVRRIFEMYSTGSSFTKIAKKLNAEGVLSPQPSRTRKIRAWHMSGVRDVLFNVRYRGIARWNRLQTLRNPYTGKREQALRPEKDWECIENGQLRIVSDELWDKAHEQNKRAREKLGFKRLGGINRAQQVYLFGGLLECGVCGTNMTIISGSRKYARYGCPNHRFRAVCSNALTIRYSRLEAQLIEAIAKKLANPQMKEMISRNFDEQLRNLLLEEQAHLETIEEERSQLTSERSNLQRQAENVIKAISQHGLSDSLSAQLRITESKLQQLEKHLEKPARPLKLSFAEDEIQLFVEQEATDFSEALAGDRLLARQELQKRISKLILTPSTEDGGVFEVSGDVRLFVGADGGMQSNSLEICSALHSF
ncbi:MAG: recombinase family protein [Acidobacteriales bacterium]|nr:recombinase family protein [Terriglobales bacterium]